MSSVEKSLRMIYLQHATYTKVQQADAIVLLKVSLLISVYWSTDEVKKIRWKAKKIV